MNNLNNSYSNTSYNHTQDIHFENINSNLTPPIWFNDLHRQADLVPCPGHFGLQSGADGQIGSLDTYCELSVPPHRGAESEPEFIHDLQQLQQFIKKKTSVLDARKGASGFIFYPNIARKRIKKIFSVSSPIAHQAFSFTDDEKQEYFRHSRKEKYLLQKIAKAICIDHKRLTYCGSTVIDVEKGASVFWDNSNEKSYYAGHQTCEFAGCPICQAKKANADEQEIRQAMQTAKAKGWDYLMFTPTTRHKKHNTLAEIMDYRSKVFECFRNCKPYRKLKRLGYVGDIIALETPHSDANGWHAHNHNIMLFDKNIQDNQEFIQNKLISAWLSACEKVIKKYNLNPHDLMPEPEFINVTFNKKEIDDNIADYLVKQGADQRIIEFKNGSQMKIKSKSFIENPRWGAPKEMTRGNSKRSKGSSLTPFDMLRAIAQDPENYDDKYPLLFREWVNAIKGKALLRWSPKLREKIFGDDYKEQREQAKADTVAENHDKVMDLTAEQDKAIQHHNSESDFLSLVERNHMIGDIDTKAILSELVGLYRVEIDQKPIFKMNMIDNWINGQLVQEPILYREPAPCEIDPSLKILTFS